MRRCQYILHDLGFTLQRPRYKFPKADPEVQDQFVQEFKKNSSLLD
ncbi:MAG: winged helix-turn-helix domain-containing protein [Candidatus Helarchaeota archaeon]